MLRMRKVIFDANFLLVPFQFKIDIFDSIEALIGRFKPIVLSTTLEELKKLSMGKSEKTRRYALSALELAKKCKVINVKAELSESHDDVILRVARDGQFIVATNDSKLRRRLREAGVTTIFLRQKAYLQVDGVV
ncbi:nucleotide-binding protein [Candidatus Bathyarchaeota archaeon]|nr:nucleotide-binding protein [Candidatus Bathyarchaeota archaeon]